jgi:hypothetical protein
MIERMILDQLVRGWVKKNKLESQLLLCFLQITQF